MIRRTLQINTHCESCNAIISVKIKSDFVSVMCSLNLNLYFVYSYSFRVPYERRDMFGVVQLFFSHDTSKIFRGTCGSQRYKYRLIGETVVLFSFKKIVILYIVSVAVREERLKCAILHHFYCKFIMRVLKNSVPNI